MSYQIKLPKAGGSLYTYELSNAAFPQSQPVPSKSRIAFAAAHVVADPFADTDPLSNSQIDWEGTMAYRRHLWSLGFAVAEAMDTSQRGMGLNWSHAQELIKRSIAEAKAVGGEMANGAGTDHLLPGPDVTLEQVEQAYEEQCAYIEGLGGRIILMASRALAACAKSQESAFTATFYKKYHNRLFCTGSAICLTRHLPATGATPIWTKQWMFACKSSKRIKTKLTASKFPC